MLLNDGTGISRASSGTANTEVSLLSPPYDKNTRIVPATQIQDTHTCTAQLLKTYGTNNYRISVTTRIINYDKKSQFLICVNMYASKSDMCLRSSPSQYELLARSIGKS